MKTLRLEVGKTYRSRNGDEVSIVEKGGGLYVFRGSDDERYTESGRFDISVAESECDLIAEVPETRYTFAIPDGVTKLTVEQVSNRIIVEMVPTASPKPGDVMINERDSVYIFKEVINPNSHSQYAWLGKAGNLFIDYGRCAPGRPATPEEAKPLWDALKKAGKRWNPEAMRVEEISEFEHILEWVEANIKDGYYNHEDVAEVIESYIKHKEGEKCTNTSI